MSPDTTDRPSKDRPVAAWLGIIGIVLSIAAITFSVHRYLVNKAVEEGRPVAEQHDAERTAQDQAQARQDTLRQLLTELSARVETSPDDSMLVISAANIAYDLGNFEEAERFYRLFLDNIDPHSNSARIDLSYVVFRQGRTEEAFDMLNMIIKKAPSNQTAMFNLAYMYDQAGQSDKAVQWMQRVVKTDPNSELGQRAQMILEQQNN